MPTPEEIVAGLREIANDWKTLAIGWHLYFAVLVGLVIRGARMTRRVMGLLLAVPLLSVSLLAWTTGNPVNGIVFATVALILGVIAARFDCGHVSLTGPLFSIPGALLFLFAWIYPHFLEGSSPWAYLYAAPTGLIPCPTLSAIIGLSLILGGLESRAWMLLLGATGLVYGLIGAMVLNVAIDGVLAFGALAIIAVGLRPDARQRRPDITTIAQPIQDDGAKPRFREDLVQELPEPARRYLLHSIQVGTPLARSVRLTMSGRMRPREGAQLIALTAEELLAAPRGFLWTAHLRIGPIPIRVRDHYIDDDGAVAVTALGIIPIGRQSGPKVARSSRHRLAGGAVWLPSALVPGPGVTWDAVDSAHARVTITIDGEDVPLTLKIDEQGRLRKLLMERYGNVGVKEWQLIPYGFAIEEERTFDGFTIPSRIRGGWWYGTDRYDPEGATFLQIERAKYL